MITRRQFVWTAVTAGGGLAVGLAARPALRLRQRMFAAPVLGANAWIEIDANGRIVVKSTLTEMGQGAWRTLAQIVAEELDAVWDQVHVEMAPAWRTYDAPIGFLTGGSTSTKRLFAGMRMIAATARLMLLEAAAETWGVDISTCVTASGAVQHLETRRVLTYGDLSFVATRRSPPKGATLKSRDQWRVLGKSLPATDISDLVTGRTQYGMDLQLPNMLVATVSLQPLPGAVLEHFDRVSASTANGVVQLVELENGIAVVAKTYWQAQRAMNLAAPRWRLPAISTDEVQTQLLSGLQTVASPITAEKFAHRVVANYSAPLLLHAQLEPLNATARVSHIGAEVWVPTQAQGAMQNAVAHALGFSPYLVTVRTPRVGGGFGRRLGTDYGVVAALVARHFDVPVKVVYSREEDSRQGRFRPMSVAHIEAGLSVDGAIDEVRVEVASLGVDPRLGGLDKIPYAVGKISAQYAGVDTPIRTGPWRSVDNSQNLFFRESFIDECAIACNRDPLEYRVELLAHNARAQRVLKTLEHNSNWTSACNRGCFLGVTYSEEFDSLTALAVELVAAGYEQWRIDKVFAVIDCGLALNPDGVRGQMEGGILFGLSAALREAVVFNNGAQREVNYDNYQVLCLGDTPLIQVEVIESPDAGIGGVGEAGVPGVAPAISNALYAACGKRIRELPFSRSGLVAASNRHER